MLAGAGSLDNAFLADSWRCSQGREPAPPQVCCLLRSHRAAMGLNVKISGPVAMLEAFKATSGDLGCRWEPRAVELCCTIADEPSHTFLEESP